jgi:hypothetical protein
MSTVYFHSSENFIPGRKNLSTVKKIEEHLIGIDNELRIQGKLCQM